MEFVINREYSNGIEVVERCYTYIPDPLYNDKIFKSEVMGNPHYMVGCNVASDFYITITVLK